MHRPLLLAILALFTYHLNAQFGRVAVNSDNIPYDAIIQPYTDTDFVAVFFDEMYHLRTIDGITFSITPVTNAITGIRDVKTHDIDLDGDLDVIVWAYERGQFTVYRNDNGDLIYYPEGNFSGKPHHLHSQDWDGDGVRDLMINHRVYKTTGPYEWEQVLRYPLINTYEYRYTQFIDHDEDGDMDVLFHQVHWLRVLVNDGDGTTVELLDLDETQNRVSWCRVIETTAGQKTIYYDRAADMIREVRFSSDGYMLVDIVPLNLSENYSDAIQKDIDGDGNEEIIIHSESNRSIVVFSYDPDTGTGIVTTTSYDSFKINAFSLFVFDGKVKLFGGNGSTFRVWSFDGAFNAVLEKTSTIAISAGSFGDIDGDGYVDVISGSQIKRYLGEATFDEVTGITYPSTGGSLSDYDNDGDLDYVKPDAWFENIGDLMFGPEQVIINNDPTPDPEIFFTAELLRADIDLDGDTDILTYNNFGEPLELLENIENDYFEDPVTLATSEDIGGDAILARVIDMDLDGDMDIIMVAESGVILLKGNGGVGFDPAIPLYGGERLALSAELGDINSDGYPDLIVGTRDIVAGAAIGEAILYMGSADIPDEEVISSGNGYYWVGYANIDGVGWQDIVYQSSDGLYWVSTADAVDFLVTRIDASLVDNGRFIVADVNSDGDDDIIVYRSGELEMYYYLNGESGSQSFGCPTGDVYLRSQDQVNAFPKLYGVCPELPGDLYIGRPFADWSDITDLTPLRGVEKINGTLNLYYDNGLSTLTGLEDLHTIGGALLMDGYKSNDFSGIENLRTIGGDINFRNVSTIGGLVANLDAFESLDSIGGSVIMRQSNVRSVAAFAQPVFHGDFVVEDCFLYDTTGLDVIDSVYGELIIVNTDLQDLAVLRDLEYVEGLTISRNDYLGRLRGLKNITEISGDVVISGNPFLKLTSVMDSLRRVGGDLYYNGPECQVFNELRETGGKVTLIAKVIGENSFAKLHSAESLSILAYEGEDLRQFSNLDQLAGTLNITNNKITSLYGLHNIQGEITNLDITSNYDLTRLDDLHDSLTVSGEIRLFRNYALTFCNSYPICNHVASGGPATIFDNGPGCLGLGDLRCNDTGLSGFVFHDRNMNGAKDVNEAPLSNIEVIFTIAEDTTITATDGFFIGSVSPGDSAHIRARVPDEWQATTPFEISIDSFMPGLSSNSSLVFGMIPLFNTRDYELNTNSSLFLCDREFNVQVDVRNAGTATDRCLLEVHYPHFVKVDPAFLEFTTHDESTRIMTFDLDTVYPFFSDHIAIPFVAPAAEHLEEMFSWQISLFSVNGIDKELLEQDKFDLLLLCSYDPNDKLVRTPRGDGNLQLDSDDALTYTIRFQNTGNYYAENVVITDTLSPLLDISTFEFLATSHPVEISRDGRVLYFRFNMINLPDSLLDFEGSQGFVSFRVKPLSTMTPDQRILNDANIYFDFNAPILTNEVESVVLESTSTWGPDPLPELSIYPNPSTSLVYLQLAPDQSPETFTYEVISMMGRCLRSGIYSLNGIDVSGLAPGVYTVLIADGRSAFGLGKLVKL